MSICNISGKLNSLPQWGKAFLYMQKTKKSPARRGED